MAIKHAESNEVIDVHPLGDRLVDHKTCSLFKSHQLEVLRLVLPKGKVIPVHKAPGDITVHCIEGRVAFSAMGVTRELAAGTMLYLAKGEPHALESLEHSSVLVTIVLAHQA